MSGGGPPHHPHNRHLPPSNSAWNHLPIPTYLPRQPQVAHMQAEHSLLHQPTWHTPTTTDTMKLLPRQQMLNEMFKNEALFPRDCVDLSLTRNGNQNGELAPTPAAISLSVRDANKINSLPPSMIDIQAIELTKCSNLKAPISPGSIRATSMSPGLLTSGPALKSLSPGRKSLSPGPKSSSPGLNLGLPAVSATLSSFEGAKNPKRSNIRVDSILERLNPFPEKTFPHQELKPDQICTVTVSAMEKTQSVEKPSPPPERPVNQGQSVIVSAAASYDENSNSSGATNVPTPKEEDSASMHSNEDSLDSTKSRRKRKPSKTVRVNKEDEIKTEADQAISESSDLQTATNHEEPTNPVSQSDPSVIATILEGSEAKSEKFGQEGAEAVVAAKTRRKTSSESETIDNIAAMVQEGLKEKKKIVDVHDHDERKAEEAVVKDFEADKEKNEIKEIGADEIDIAPTLYKGDEKTEKTESKESALPDNVVDDSKENNCRESEPSLPDPASATKPVTVSVIKTKEILEETLTNNPNPSREASKIPPSALAPTLITPAQKKASITHFVEVENKLEEMFAGIVEEDHADPVGSGLGPLKSDSNLGLTDDSLMKLDDSVALAKEEINASQILESPDESPNFLEQDVKEEPEDKKPYLKKAQRPRPLSKDGEVPAKKKKLTKTKNSGTTPKKLCRSPVGVITKSPKKSSLSFGSNKTPTKASSSDVIKDVYAYDSSSNASSSKSRGPFVQIRGPRDSPLSVNVINAPLTGDDDGERKPAKSKKFHDDSEYRHKVRSKGLHCSTLSTKYDAERKDATWICAFCKRGPHATELSGPSVVNGEFPAAGDLFGPYIITTQCPEFERRLDDPYDRQFKSRKISKALDAENMAMLSSKNPKKAKRKSESSVDPTDTFLGITDTGKNTYEVWTHEDCMVWSSGLYLVGPRIVGLEEAVWTCSNMSCSGCGLKGANVSCYKRGCLEASHVCCARKTHWYLDELNFKACCPLHAR